MRMYQATTPTFVLTLPNTVDLTAVADAIRAKTGSTEPLVFPQVFVDAINSI